jgi:hypothetical protein
VSRCGTDQATALTDSVCALFDRVFAEPPHRWTVRESDRHRDVFVALLHRFGFELAVAEADGAVVGAAYGYPLEPADAWWEKVTGPLPSEFTEEWPGRTFLINGIAIEQDWRRRRVGCRLVECLLSDRHEQRVTYSVQSGAVGVHMLIGQPDCSPVGRRIFPPGAAVDSLAVYALKLPITKP